MATTTEQTLLLQHPSHLHPLKLQDLSNEPLTLRCRLCRRNISSAKAYTCQEGCDTFSYSYHRVCVEAPPRIDRHPLHPFHPLPLIHGRLIFICDACGKHFYQRTNSLFGCDECGFYLDICCALSTLSDEGGSQGGKTSELITLPLHHHMLTSFSTRHDFVRYSECYICQGNVEGDGYTCLCLFCEFVIHKRCIQDLYYADGTKAPRVYHGHPLKVFVGEDTGSNTCARCGSDKLGEFIGCASCQVFYHRHCFQVPEILQYPSHNQDHTLVLFPEIGTPRRCQSCSSFLKNEIYYCCTSCEFFVHVGCAFQVLDYCEEGMSAKIKLSWHKHPLLLCHQTTSFRGRCAYCEDESIGPTYVCEDKGCRFLLHKRCTEIESTIINPHHPDHPLTLCERDDDDDDDLYFCEACRGITDVLKFSCERCLVNLHIKCAARFPTHKHYLHEHKLLHFKGHRSLECNRCGRSTTNSSVFRCVSCNFNLHEECMELPQVVASKIHWHPLTLHETFLEDDSGEYYCEHCEKTRDPRLGAYVCGQCKISVPRIYHIECALPEIGKVYEKKSLPPAVEKLNKQIADKREEVHTIKEEVRTMIEKVRTMKKKLQQATLELEELEMQRYIIGEIEDES